MTRPRIRSLLVVLVTGAASFGATVWTVDDAVNTALRQNPDIQSARHRIDASHAMLKQADSAWMPQLILTGGYTQTNNAATSLIFTLYQRTFGFDLNLNRPGWIDDLNLVGTVSYNLYSGGQPTARRTAARAGTRAAEQDLRAVQQQLAAEVVKVMLNLRKAREGVTSLEAGVKAYEASVANARLRFDAGQTLKADLLSLEVQTVRTRELLSSARHGAALAARMFTFVLGSDANDEPVELAENDPALAGLTVPDATDFSQRPELLALQERLRSAEALVDAARGGRRPVVNAYIASQYDQGWQYARHADSLQGGVTVELNVFDGGRNSGKIRQAAAELAQVKDQLRKTTLSLGLEVEKARLAYADARERLTVTAGAVDQAEESASLNRARFETGALLTSELIGAESRLIEMRMFRTLASADERIALVELRRALGLPPTARP
jgi:outer membrane protein TolC